MNPGSLGDWKKRSHEAHVLPNGLDIGHRYTVLRFLGRGGMGAVYQVHDRELERDVALKLIREEHEHSDIIIQRFKREIQLSSIVTHPNVLRVYDLGEADGVKYLTMQYVDGEDLGALLHRTRLPLEQTLAIFRQVCSGLAAAHEEGVIHRDLKPQNVMIDSRRHVYVTDFGLARTEDQPSLTATGAIAGTPHYMSPEQVMGKKIDHRSDIFALGVLLFEMLTGRVPFRGDSLYEMLVNRVQRKPPPVRELNAEVPERIGDVVERCLAVDPDERYQSVHELLRDLDGEAAVAPRAPSRRTFLALATAAAALLVVAAILGFAMLQRHSDPAPSAARDPLSVLVSDFRNETGDAIFDSTLEPILTIGLEGASFITAFNRGQARKAAEELKPGSGLGEAVARLVGIREGVEVVVAGSLSEHEHGFEVEARAIYTSSGRQLGSARETAGDREGVLRATAAVAQKLRSDLGDVTPEAALEAERETFTSSSIIAAQKYAQGQEQQWQGKYEEAIAKYAEAVKLDPAMGRAYAGMAAMYANMGERDKAEEYYRLALQNIDRMTDREKYRTRGGYYLLTRNHEKAFEEYSTLTKEYPADTAGINNLAFAHFYRREMDQALELGKRAVAIYPKNVLYRNNLALYALYASDFEEAKRQAAEVLKINPSFAKAYVAHALAEAATGNLEAAADAYRELESVSARGASLAGTGLADLALFRGDHAAAIAILRRGIASDEEAGSESAARRKRIMLAEALGSTRECGEAAREITSAVDRVEDDTALFAAGRVLVSCGEQDRAAAIAERLDQRLETEPRLYAKLIEAETLLQANEPRAALRVLGEAQQIADSWLGRLLRGRAYNDLGAYAEASSELDIAMKRSGEAVALLLDDVPSVRELASLAVERQRARDGLGKSGTRAASSPA